jgi:hypothetical protein
MTIAVEPEWLRERLLAVLKGSTKIPGTHDLLPLAEELTMLKATVEFWKEEKGDLYVAAANAVATLNKILPSLRWDYEMGVYGAEDWGLKEAEIEARANLTTFDAFANAVRHAPIFNPSLPRMDRWKDYAQQLEEAFHVALPDGGKENGYRFVQALIPEISGETSPTFEAVKTHLKRRVGRKV